MSDERNGEDDQMDKAAVDLPMATSGVETERGQMLRVMHGERSGLWRRWSDEQSWRVGRRYEQC